MNLKSTRALFACFIGGFIGTLVALQLSHYLWWIGMIVGAVVGYVSYCYRDVPSACRKVWQMMPEGKQLVCTMKTAFKIFMLVLGGISFLVAFIVSGLGTLNGVITAFAFWYQTFFITSSLDGIVSFGSALLWSLPAFVFVILCLMSGMLSNNINENWEKHPDNVFIPLCLFVTPITLPIGAFLVFLFVCWCVYAVITIVPKATVWCATFTAMVLAFVHSEQAILCGVCSALGTAVGYLFGNAIVGGLAGLALGWADFRFIVPIFAKMRTRAQ